jgi:hypothetical protein
MLSYPNLLMIGANARNTGKTTLACRIIEHFSDTHTIIGLKVTRVKPGEEPYHGSHEDLHLQGWSIQREDDPGSRKDTGRMLTAGAKECYYICADESTIEEAFSHFIRTTVPQSLLVCESRSLRNWVVPAIFILMTRNDLPSTSKNVDRFRELANISSSKGNDDEEIERIVSKLEVVEGKWHLRG